MSSHVTPALWQLTRTTKKPCQNKGHSTDKCLFPQVYMYASKSVYGRARVKQLLEVNMSFTGAVSTHAVIIPVVGNTLSVSQQMRYRTSAVSHVSVGLCQGHWSSQEGRE